MEAVNELKKIPPVTRTLIGTTLAITVPPMLHLISPYLFFFSIPRITTRFEVWRAITPFFFGSSGLNLLFDLFMLYRDSNALELAHFGMKTADYAWTLILINLGILALSYPLKAVVFFRPMLLAIVYLNTLMNPGGQVSLFGMITVPSQYFPWLLLVMDGAQGGLSYLMQSATGVISAHIVHALLLSRPPSPILATPTLLKRWLNQTAGVTQGGVRLGGGVTGFAPRNNTARTGGSGTRTETTGGHSWGSGGNRLG